MEKPLDPSWIDPEALIGKAIRRIHAQEPIRTALLTGSQTEGVTDKLSDYDLALFCTTPQVLAEDAQWLKEIAPVWVCVRDEFLFEGQKIPTRLVIFEGGRKVDFAFFPLDLLQKLSTMSSLPDEFNMGYRVLVDKDDLTREMASPTFEGFREQKPSKKAFHNTIEEFWFEVYHVAKYLWREDLWSVQFRLSSVHAQLLQMIRWNEAAMHQWNYTTSSIGKRLREWVGDQTWQDLDGIFPHFDSPDGWRALSNAMVLFQKLTEETGRLLDYSTSSDLARNMMDFVIGLSKEQEVIAERQQGVVHVALLVRDYDEAITFFTEKLWFTLVEDTYQPEQNKRWVIIAPPGQQRGTTLLLARPSKPEQLAYIGNQTGGRVFLFLQTNDFWRDYQAMQDRGIEFARPPKQESYGTVAVFKDLYGNLWDLIEYAK